MDGDLCSSTEAVHAYKLVFKTESQSTLYPIYQNDEYGHLFKQTFYNKISLFACRLLYSKVKVLQSHILFTTIFGLNKLESQDKSSTSNCAVLECLYIRIQTARIRTILKNLAIYNLLQNEHTYRLDDGTWVYWSKYWSMTRSQQRGILGMIVHFLSIIKTRKFTIV